MRTADPMRRATRRARSAKRSSGRILAVLSLALVWVVGGTTGAGIAEERPFVQLLTSEPDSLDPGKTNSVQADRVIWLLYDCLTHLSADGTQMGPALAERWEQSADGLTYTFTLRRNVRFHDGTLLDAQAVKVSYERQFLAASPFYSPSPPNAYERVLADLVKAVQVLDPQTVAITLSYPRPSQFGLVKIVSPTALTRHGLHLTRTPVGTGPFRLERWEGNRIILAPFAESWRGRPRLGGVTFSILPDSQVAMERLEDGDLDLVPEVPAHLLERLGANPVTRLVKVGGLNLRFLGMQMDRPALQDRRVREAIARAVDRERLATFLGRATMLPARGPLPPASQSYDPQLRQPAHDLPRARELLQEAGAGTGLMLRLLYNASLEHWSEVVQAIRSDLRKAGIGIELLGTPDWKTFHEERKKGTHDLYLYGWSVSTPDPERFLFPLFQSKSPSNFGHFNNPKVDDLLDQARQPMEETRRLRLYRDVTRVILADLPAVFLFHQITFAAHHARVSGMILNLYGLPQDKLVSVEVR
jgi:peptide/nickel transport system substrate-binding protein